MVKLVPKSENVKKKLDEIESEMKHLGMWSKTPLPKEVFQDMGAFGMKTMSFDQWLQFVFVPNVRKLLKTNGRGQIKVRLESWLSVNLMVIQN